MLQLIAPTVRLHAAWLDAHREWGPGSHEDGFGLGPDDEIRTVEGFAAWVARLAAVSDLATSEPAITAAAASVSPDADSPENALAGRSRAVFRWIVEDGRVLGGIVLRPADNDLTRRYGHIGYGIRPSARGRGVATWALDRMLAEARALGMPQVLLVCVADNRASAATIERNGGVLDAIAEDGSTRVRHYVIEL